MRVVHGMGGLLGVCLRTRFACVLHSGGGGDVHFASPLPFFAMFPCIPSISLPGIRCLWRQRIADYHRPVFLLAGL